MESVRLKGILAELESKQAELKKTALEHTPAFKSLAEMIASWQKVEDMVGQQECLEKIKPVLVEQISKVEQAERDAAGQGNKERLGKEIRKVSALLHKVKPCTQEQTALLLRLSKLKKEMNKNG